MRIQTRLLLLLLVVAVVPVLVSGITAVALSRSAITHYVQASNVTEARYLAEAVDSYIADALRELRLAVDYTPFATLAPDERQGALGLAYRLNDGFNVVSLINAAGDGVGAPVFALDPEHEPGAAHHQRVSEADLNAFSQHVPLEAALTAGAAVGPVYLSPDKRSPALVLAVKVADLGGDQVLAVELTLDPVATRVREIAAQADASAYVVDGRGQVVAHSLPEVALLRAPFAEREPVRLVTGAGLESAGAVNYTSGDTLMAAAYARLGRLPWGVVVERPQRVAFSHALRIQWQTVFWVVIALLCAVISGVVLARSIGDPIRSLDRAALAVKQGDLSVRARVEGGDELARLATSFNAMADEIARRDDELRQFNLELQARVEDRTRALKQAQDQLLRSEKLAAVGELGAGVAHEINNPLAGVLGSAQLLLLRAEPDHPSITHLKNIENEALRIRDIVRNLLQLSQTRDEHSGVLVDVNRVIEAALNLVARPIIAQRIRVKKTLATELPKVRADPSELQQVFLHLLSNAKNAMPEGGELRLTSSLVEDRLVQVTVADTGVGIRPEDLDKIFEPFFTRKEDWHGKGLGLAVVHRTVEQMGGRITVESDVGRGAAFTLLFPIARENLHLA